jgi:hypothetical protein
MKDLENAKASNGTIRERVRSVKKLEEAIKFNLNLLEQGNEYARRMLE